MLIKFDPAANAVYLTIHEPRNDSDRTTVTEDGLIVDFDAEGNARGYEWLTVRQRGLPTNGLPPEVASFVEDFVDSGALLSESAVERRHPR
jgi:uncharacterized protein YuzE